MAVSKQARMGWGGERERRMGVRDGEGKKKGGGRGVILLFQESRK